PNKPAATRQPPAQVPPTERRLEPVALRVSGSSRTRNPHDGGAREAGSPLGRRAGRRPGRHRLRGGGAAPTSEPPPRRRDRLPLLGAVPRPPRRGRLSLPARRRRPAAGGAGGMADIAGGAGLHGAAAQPLTLMPVV